MNSGESGRVAATQGMPLADAVNDALEAYFDQLNGHDCHNLYDLVLAEVERPLLRCVLHRCDGNQTKAAKLLGINRGTLRKKLEDYDLN
ncbi:MAG: DNA-binding transcriptional regulator Fis [Thiotrichales bacterium]